MSNFEKDQLVRELQDRSHDVGGHPIDFDSVRQSARRIRRRRNWVGGAVAAMVAAVAIPSGLAVSNSLTTAEGPNGDSPVAGSPDKPELLTLNGLERGDDPKIDYLARRDLVGADGSVTRLDGTYTKITPYFPGWLAGTWSENGPVQVFLDEDGQTLRSQPGSDFVVNASASQIAYVTAAEGVQDGQKLVLAPTMGSESLKQRQSVPADASPIGFLDEDTVVYRTEGVEPRTFVTSFDGAAAERVPGLRGAAGASESGLIAGMTTVTDEGSCSAVVRADGFQRLWQTCDFTLLTFSPDGRHVLATSSYRDGLGDRELAILDARTGEVVRHYEKKSMGSLHINHMVWEDDTHALATVFEDGEWAVVRVDTEGNVESATEPVPGLDMECPLFFSARP
ncbi:MAG: hypothetical protein ACRDPJ_01325 [Nocardioidaceae bacterium]